jgi:hypothetical protein
MAYCFSFLRTAAWLFAACSLLHTVSAQNQTESLTPVLPPDTLPFSLEIEQASFGLPTGLQGHAAGVYDGLWVLIAGRTNGLHGFDNHGNNFPVMFQNTTVYIVDPSNGFSWNRSLKDPGSGLSQEEIDILSVTAPEFFQKGKTLYLVGGYGINTATQQMDTKKTLTAIDLEKLIRWVKCGVPSVKNAIRQTTSPFLQVTGGALFQDNDHAPFLLMLGQDFEGLYVPSSNGIYTEQIRAFWLNDDGKHLSITPHHVKKRPDYRRRDLNAVPILHNQQTAYVAFAGVFALEGGVWTVPITISPDGSSFEPNPQAPQTFKQAMNQYNCACFGLYSSKANDMYVVFPGGISFGYFENGEFQTDEEDPFINQVTTIKIDKHNSFSQYLMEGEYPYIVSTGSNPGNQLLFGAEATFFPAGRIPLFRNGVIRLDELPKEPTVIGYIAGGIMSTLPNTNTMSDSTASPYVFKVTLIPTVSSSCR